MNFNNPVLRGFHPDPSICRVDDVFYLACSSFEFYPGVPLFESRDLINWKPVGFAVTEAGGMKLTGAENSEGLFAPTLRWHDGLFYLVVTDVSGIGNFYVTAPKIEGPWSAPIRVAQGGIDPSFFFEGPDTYFLSTMFEDGRQGIYMSKLELTTGRLLSRPACICRGTGLPSPEGPHLYRFRGRYYLMIAEGGTEYGHTEQLFRADGLWGPYLPCPHGAVLSNIGNAASGVSCTGHADLVELKDGGLAAVFLGVRPLDRLLLHNLGRETFLAPVTWRDDDWFVIGDGGRTRPEMEIDLPWTAERQPPVRDYTFAGPEETEPLLPLEFGFVRTRLPGAYARRENRLVLSGSSSLNSVLPCFAGVRQTEFCQTAGAVLNAAHSGSGFAGGLAAYYNSDYHAECLVFEKDGTFWAVVRSTVHGLECRDEVQPLPKAEKYELNAEADQRYYRFSCTADGRRLELGRRPVAGLCTEGTCKMSFTGTWFGLFCESGSAAFERFSVEDR